MYFLFGCFHFFRVSFKKEKYIGMWCSICLIRRCRVYYTLYIRQIHSLLRIKIPFTLYYIVEYMAFGETKNVSQFLGSEVDCCSAVDRHTLTEWRLCIPGTAVLYSAQLITAQLHMKWYHFLFIFSKNLWFSSNIFRSKTEKVCVALTKPMIYWWSGIFMYYYRMKYGWMAGVFSYSIGWCSVCSHSIFFIQELYLIYLLLLW